LGSSCIAPTIPQKLRAAAGWIAADAREPDGTLICNRLQTLTEDQVGSNISVAVR
jgi:hypothetical protein